MRAHPELGVRIAESGGFSSETLDVILNHHERWDGLGYPRGLRRDEIPLCARAFSVADTYDAITSNRPYRTAMSRGDALQILRSATGLAYDPDVVDAFVGLDLFTGATPSILDSSAGANTPGS
jgi:HD-GYP domain-containing protein (c-di-GMP phosphodiesterase class II)